MMMSTISIAVLLLTFACQTTSQPGEPATQTASNVEKLLDDLEHSARDLNSFTASVVYEKEDALLGRKETRTGEVLYTLQSSTDRKLFAVLFDSLIVNQRKRDHTKHYIFDGRWLAEINHEAKQFIKREIVPPGETLDPLKLGEGPFPLPIGQAKSEVLERFTVESANPPDDGLLRDLENVNGLHLIPKPHTEEAKDFKSVDIFYDRTLLLPVGVIAVDLNDDQKTVRLNNLSRNPTLDEEALGKLDITDPDPTKWRIDIRPWKSGS